MIVGLTGRGVPVLHRKMSGNPVLRTTDLPIAAHTHLTVTFDDGWRSTSSTHASSADLPALGRDALDAFLDERLGPEPLEIELRDLDRIAGAAARPPEIAPARPDGPGRASATSTPTRSSRQARLHPLRSVESLTVRERGRLHEAIQYVLSTVIERRGTSLSDYVDAEGEPGTNQNYLQVYGRAGLPCPREACGNTINRTVMAQRGTWSPGLPATLQPGAGLLRTTR